MIRIIIKLFTMLPLYTATLTIGHPSYAARILENQLYKNYYNVFDLPLSSNYPLYGRIYQATLKKNIVSCPAAGCYITAECFFGQNFIIFLPIKKKKNK